MTTSVAKIRKRLGQKHAVLDLEERDKERIYSLLKNIGKENNGKTISDLKQQLGNNGKLKFSKNYLVGSLFWLQKEKYLSFDDSIRRRKPYFLTDEGRKALLELSNYLFVPKKSLKISLNFPEVKIIEAELSGNLENIAVNAIFSNNFIIEKILELSAGLFLPKPVTLTINIPASTEKKIQTLLKVLWSFFCQKASDHNLHPNLFGPLYLGMFLLNKKSLEKYTKFWKEQVGKYFGSRIIHPATKFPRDDFFPPFLPSELSTLPVFLKDERVKQWIENRLAKEYDWFMPHLFWVKLGFKERKVTTSVDSVGNISPPIFHEIITPQFPEFYGLFDNMIRVVDRNEEKSIRTFCRWLADADNWKDHNFYESWIILRIEHKTDEVTNFDDVFNILDRSLQEYIIAESNPKVDLSLALNDYLLSGDVEKVMIGIKKGKYNFNA